MKRNYLATFFAALAMFIWGAVFWMSPLPYKVLEHTPDDAQAGAALLQHFPTTGTYLVPGAFNDPATQQRLHEKGPIATVHIQTAGMPVTQPRVLVLGFVHYWICTLLAAFLAVRTAPVVRASYGKRVWFFALVGVLLAVFSDLAAPIWWGHPWPFHVVNAIYAVTVWLVGGLVLAAFLKAEAG